MMGGFFRGRFAYLWVETAFFALNYQNRAWTAYEYVHYSIPQKHTRPSASIQAVRSAFEAADGSFRKWRLSGAHMRQ